MYLKKPTTKPQSPIGQPNITNKTVSGDYLLMLSFTLSRISFPGLK